MKEVAKNANMAIDAIDSIKTYVEDEPLKQHILEQRARLCDIKDKAVEQLNGEKDVDIGFFQKTMLKGAIAMNTMFDKTSQNISEMLIEGNNMGINNLTTLINRAEEDGKPVPHVANELLQAYHDDVNHLRTFL